MDLFWAILIIGVLLLLLFAVLPSLVEKPMRNEAVSVRMSPTQFLATMEEEKSKDMLQSFYKEAIPVPVNRPRLEIGACPFSKAPSTDLPMVDMPLCVMSGSPDMRLAKV